MHSSARRISSREEGLHVINRAPRTHHRFHSPRVSSTYSLPFPFFPSFSRRRLASSLRRGERVSPPCVAFRTGRRAPRLGGCRRSKGKQPEGDFQGGERARDVNSQTLLSSSHTHGALLITAAKSQRDFLAAGPRPKGLRVANVTLFGSNFDPVYVVPC